MTRTKARIAVFTKVGQPLELRDVVLHPPGDDELIVDIDMCTICGSDVHTVLGRRPARVPVVLGHEIIGRVARLPEGGVRDMRGAALQHGDRITWSLCASCSNCHWCRNRLPQKCAKLVKYGHEPSSAEYPSTGGFASHCQLRPGTAILRIPDSMPDRVACPANCATATVAAALRTVETVAEKNVLILGAGLLGLTAAAMLRESGADEIIVLDPSSGRSALGEPFGATCTTIDAGSATSEVNRRTGARGVDLVFDFSGSSQAVSLGIQCLSHGGSAILVGAVLPTESISLSPERIVRGCLRIIGIHNYAPEDLAAAVQFLDMVWTKYPFEQLVSASFDLTHIDEALQFAASGQAVRVAVLNAAPD